MTCSAFRPGYRRVGSLSAPGRLHMGTPADRTRWHRRLLFPLSIAAITSAMATLSSVGAQSGSLGGRVMDEAGQPLPGVSVTAITEAGGIARLATSGSDGAYQFGELPDGYYRVDFDLRSFDLIRR